MIALEIYSNGRKACTIGPEGLGIQSVAATWLESGKTWDFRIRGITNEQGYEEHLNWMDQKLNIGDTITLQVVETEKTVPMRRSFRLIYRKLLLTKQNAKLKPLA